MKRLTGAHRLLALGMAMNFFEPFLQRKSVSIFRILELKLFITFDTKAIDNFWHHIWKQKILLVNILKNKDNRRILSIAVHLSMHPSICPSIRIIKVFGWFFFFWRPFTNWNFTFRSLLMIINTAGQSNQEYFFLQSPERDLQLRGRKAYELSGWVDGWWLKVFFNFSYFLYVDK